MRLHEEFGISVSDDTVYRALKDLSFSHVSARPKAYKQDADAMEAFKKTFRRVAEVRRSLRRHSDRGVVPGRDAGRPEEQTHLSLGPERLTSSRHSRSTHPIDLSVRCCLPRTRGRRRSRAAGLQQRSMQLYLDEIATKVTSGAHAIVLLDQAGWHGGKVLKVPHNISLMPLPPRAPNSTARKTSGNSCDRTGSRTGSSNPSTISSITAATPGTHSSISSGRSCRARAIGQRGLLK